MSAWTIEEQLTFDIAFALKKVTIPGFRKALTEEDRFAIALAISSADGSSQSLRNGCNDGRRGQRNELAERTTGAKRSSIENGGGVNGSTRLLWEVNKRSMEEDKRSWAGERINRAQLGATSCEERDAQTRRCVGPVGGCRRPTCQRPLRRQPSRRPERLTLFARNFCRRSDHLTGCDVPSFRGRVPPNLLQRHGRAKFAWKRTSRASPIRRLNECTI
jgi:hypothetical protein